MRQSQNTRDFAGSIEPESSLGRFRRLASSAKVTAVGTTRKTLRALGLRWPVASSSPRGLLWPPASPPSPRGPCAVPSTALGGPGRPIRSHQGYLRPGITRLSGFGAGYGRLYSMVRCENRRSSSSACFAIRNHCFARSRYTERMVSSVTRPDRMRGVAPSK